MTMKPLWRKKMHFLHFFCLFLKKCASTDAIVQNIHAWNGLLDFWRNFFFTNKFVCFAKMCFLALYLNETYTHRSVKAKKTDIARSGKQYLTAQKTHSFIW